jgi:MFS transporter, DHA2 family, multidrug resistance protein
MPDVVGVASRATDSGRAMLDGMITQQAAVMAYSNDFLLMTFVSLCAFPLLFLIRGARPAARASAPSEEHAAVMD